MRCKDGLVFAPNDARNLRCQPAEYHPFCVDHEPALFNFTNGCRICFHLE
jgi:hypothetical protein